MPDTPPFPRPLRLGTRSSPLARLIDASEIDPAEQDALLQALRTANATIAGSPTIEAVAEAIDQGHIVGQQVLHHLVRLRYGRVLLQRAFLQVLRVGAQRSGSEHPDPFRDQVDVRLCLGVLQLELFVDIEEVAAGHVPMIVTQFLVMDLVVREQFVQ